MYNHSFFIEVRPYKNLLDAGKVWELEEKERVQLVYVFQSRFYSKASSEFLEVSSEYTQVMGHCHVHLLLSLPEFEEG